MGNWRALSITIGLFIAAGVGAGSARAEDKNKGARDAKMKELETEVGNLEKLVKNAEKMSLCEDSGGKAVTARPPAGWSPAPTPPPAGQKPRKPTPGARPRLPRQGGGGSFCLTKYVAPNKKIEKLIGEIDKLNDGNPRDDKAGWVRSSWHTYRTSFQTQLGVLAKMKEIQYSAAHARMNCKAISEAQVARAKAAKDKGSIEEMDAARSAAEKDETTADSIVQTETSRQTIMEQGHDNTRTFEPNHKFDGAWKKVYQALHHSSKKLRDQWKDEWVLASRECTEPAKGEEHAGIQALEDELFASEKQKLVDDLKKWRDDAQNGLYQFDCDSMKKMHKHYCEEFDGDKDPEVVVEVGKFDAEAEKLEAEMKAKLVDPEKKLEEMSTRALTLGARRNGRMDTVEAYRGWLKEMDEIRDQVRAERDALDRVRYGGIFQGSRNPKLQLWMTYGVQRHDELSEKDKKYPDASGHPCTLADVEFCQERATDADGNQGKCTRFRRPDCVVIPTCQIFEFKPNSPAARKLGEGQLKDYKAILEKHYQTALDKKKEGKLNYDTVGGDDVLEQVEKTCAPEGKVTFQIDGNIRTYERCKETEYTCSKPAGN